MKREKKRAKIRPLADEEEVAVDVIAPASPNQYYGLLFHIEEEWIRRQLDTYHLQLECINAAWFDQTPNAAQMPVQQRAIVSSMCHIDLAITVEVFGVIFGGIDADKLQEEALLELFFTADPNVLSVQVAAWLPSTADPASIGAAVQYPLLCGVRRVRHWRLRQRLRQFWQET